MACIRSEFEHSCVTTNCAEGPLEAAVGCGMHQNKGKGQLNQKSGKAMANALFKATPRSNST